MANTVEDNEIVPVYDIVQRPITVSAQVDENFEVSTEGIHRFQIDCEETCEQSCVAHIDNTSRRPLQNILSISERKRRKIASACCVCGVFGIAAGAGFILIYLLGEYTSLFRAFSSLHTLSIPGFAFLFLGIFTSVFGIFFCWIYTSESVSRTNGRQELRARLDGLELPGHGEYDNPALEEDIPPSYSSVARTQSFITSLLKDRVSPIHKLPSYKSAIKIQKKEEDKPPACDRAAEEIDLTESPPPPY